MEDDREFLLKVAEWLRDREARTMVARVAYDRVADQLEQLAVVSYPNAPGPPRTKVGKPPFLRSGARLPPAQPSL